MYTFHDASVNFGILFRFVPFALLKLQETCWVISHCNMGIFSRYPFPTIYYMIRGQSFSFEAHIGPELMSMF